MCDEGTQDGRQAGEWIVRYKQVDVPRRQIRGAELRCDVVTEKSLSC